jgi:hypothetical protein
MNAAAFNLAIDPAALKLLIEQIAVELLGRLEADRARLNGRIAYREAEAAPLVGLEVHQLAGERKKGRIAASIGPGQKILYSRENLLEYLARRPWTPEATASKGENREPVRARRRRKGAKA